MPEWREVQPSDDGKYAYIEQLPGDAPPVLLIQFCEGGQCFWHYWTTAGWAALTSRVCVFERPEDNGNG